MASSVSFSTLLVGLQEGHPVFDNTCANIIVPKDFEDNRWRKRTSGSAG